MCVRACVPMCVASTHSMMVSGTPVDEDLSAAVLGSLCEQRRWERLAQLVGLLAQHGQPPGSCLSPQVLVQVMTALEAAGAWVYAYQVLKVRLFSQAHTRRHVVCKACYSALYSASSCQEPKQCTMNARTA